MKNLLLSLLCITACLRFAGAADPKIGNREVVPRADFNTNNTALATNIAARAPTNAPTLHDPTFRANGNVIEPENLQYIANVSEDVQTALNDHSTDIQNLQQGKVASQSGVASNLTALGRTTLNTNLSINGTTGSNVTLYVGPPGGNLPNVIVHNPSGRAGIMYLGNNSAVQDVILVGPETNGFLAAISYANPSVASSDAKTFRIDADTRTSGGRIFFGDDAVWVEDSNSDLGRDTNRWRTIYATTVDADDVDATTVTASGTISADSFSTANWSVGSQGNVVGKTAQFDSVTIGSATINTQRMDRLEVDEQIVTNMIHSITSFAGNAATVQLDFSGANKLRADPLITANQTFQITNPVPGVEIELQGYGTNHTWSFTGPGLTGFEINWTVNSITNGATAFTLTNPIVVISCDQTNGATQFTAVYANRRR